MLSPTLIIAPTDDVVTLDETKAHLYVDFSDDDDLIQSMIDAAVAHLDGFTGILGRAIAEQTWSQEYDRFCGDLVLPFGPVKSVTSVAYDSTTFSEYRLLADGRGPFLRVNDDASWPSSEGPVVVTFVAGYNTIPEPIKAAVKLHVGSMYQFRETMGENVKPSGAYEALTAPYRVWRG